MRRLNLAERRRFAALDRLIAESEKLAAMAEALADRMAQMRRTSLIDHPFHDSARRLLSLPPAAPRPRPRTARPDRKPRRTYGQAANVAGPVLRLPIHPVCRPKSLCHSRESGNPEKRRRPRQTMP
jgi:hypothetical protein